METRFVRLKPYNKRRMHLMRRYSVKRKRFIAGRWYQVPLALAEYLEGVTSKPEDLTTPLAFDVVHTKAEAQHLAKREKMLRERATAENPELMTLTTGDLRSDEIREVDISADDDVVQRTKQDPLRNPRMSEAQALEALEDGEPPGRMHSIDSETVDRPAPAEKTRARTPAKKPAARRGKAKSTRRKAKATRKSSRSQKPPAELDAANWKDDDGDSSNNVDPLS